MRARAVQILGGLCWFLPWTRSLMPRASPLALSCAARTCAWLARGGS